MKSYVKVWCVRCLCDQDWIMENTTSLICTCGAKLVRTGKKCHAEIDTNKYDISKQPHKEPRIYQYDMPVKDE